MRVIIILGALTLSLLLVEGLLRLTGVSHPVFDQTDPVLGTALIPNAEGLQTQEGRSFVRINGFGFRDAERPPAKRPGTLRIAVLGDSFTEARQVDLQDTFCSVLERELNRSVKRSAGNIEVLNFGVSGYGTSQELLTLRHRVWQFHPDAVLLAFFTGNDISDNSRALKGSSDIPYHYYAGENLLIDRTFTKSDGFQNHSGDATVFARRALQHSRLLQLLNHVRLMRTVADYGNNGPSEPGLRREVYLSPANEEWEEAWRVTEGLLAAMHHEVSARGLPFFVVVLSSGIQVHPDPEVRSKFMSDNALDDLFYPDRRIESLGAREGFPVLTLAPVFQSCAESNGAYLHGFEPRPGFGHWNEAGHRLAGERIAGWLTPQLTPTEVHVTQSGAMTESPSLY